MEAFTPVMMVDMVSTVVMPSRKDSETGMKHNCSHIIFASRTAYIINNWL